jgi:hypothetical protein
LSRGGFSYWNTNERNEFLEDRVPGWEPFAEVASHVIAFICILPAVPFVLSLAALGGLVEYLESKGKL